MITILLNCVISIQRLCAQKSSSHRCLMGYPPVLWVSRCEYLSSQRVGQCGLFAAYSPTEYRERGEERCSDIIEYNPASTSSQKWWLITPLRPCITPTTKLSFRSCSVLHYSSVRSCKVQRWWGTFQKGCFSPDYVWYPKEIKSINVTFFNILLWKYIYIYIYKYCIYFK